MENNNLKEILKEVISKIEKRIEDMPPYGDAADFGNEIGYCVGQSHFFTEEDTQDFITGLIHGISLTNGTH